jgi:hypothetical protein
VVGVGADAERLGGRGDLSGQGQVEVGQRPVLLGDQPNLQHAGTQVEIRMVACGIGDPSDLIDQLQAFGEVAGSEDREGNRPQDSPVVDAGSIVELLRGDQLSHGCHRSVVGGQFCPRVDHQSALHSLPRWVTRRSAPRTATSRVTAVAMTASLSATTRAESRSTPDGIDLSGPQAGSVPPRRETSDADLGCTTRFHHRRSKRGSSLQPCSSARARDPQLWWGLR